MRFFSAPDGPPLSSGANFTAKVVYQGGFTATVTGIRIKVDPTSDKPFAPVIDWSKARIDADIPDTATSALGDVLAALPSPLPFPITIKPISPQPGTAGTPLHLGLDVSFSGIPGFEQISFDAKIDISPDGTVKLQGVTGAIRIPILVPIGTTGLQFDGYKISYDPSNKVIFGTTIDPVGSGGTLVNTVVTVTMPLPDPSEGIGFTGTLSVGPGSAVPLAALEDGLISPTAFHAHLDMPPPGGATPFGTQDVFHATATFDLDKDGFRCTDGYLSLFKGAFTATVNAVFGFNGSGHFLSTQNIKLLDAKGTLEVSYNPGFSNFTVKSTASVSIKLQDFKPITVSAEIDGTLTPSPEMTVKATILGTPINASFDGLSPPSSLADFLQLQLKPEDLTKAVNALFHKGEAIVAQLDPTSSNSALRKSFASLVPFAHDVDAQAAYNQIADAAARAGNAVNQAANDAGNFANQAGAAIGGAATTVYKSVSSAVSSVTGGFGLGGGVVLPALRDNLLDNIIDRIKNSISSIQDASPLEALSGKIAATVIDKSVSAGTDVVDKSVQSALHIEFDQVVYGLTGIDTVNKTSQDGHVFFLITGTGNTVRSGQRLSASFSEWGYVQVQSVGGAKRVSIGFPDLQDGSLFHAKSRCYKALKDLVTANLPGIDFVTPDPNDPGPVPLMDPFRDQPPIGNLPIILDGFAVPSGAKLDIEYSCPAFGQLSIKLLTDNAADPELDVVNVSTQDSRLLSSALTLSASGSLVLTGAINGPDASIIIKVSVNNVFEHVVKWDTSHVTFTKSFADKVRIHVLQSI